MLKFDKTTIEGFDIKYGEKAQFDITVTNDSDKEIHLNVNSSSCSCTQGQVEGNPVIKGTPSKLIIFFNSAKSGIGSQVKSLNLSWFYNGTTYREKIIVKGNVSRS